MEQDRDSQIRQRAHTIWIEEGMPDGQADQHWARAESEFKADEAAATITPASAAGVGASADQPETKNDAPEAPSDVSADTAEAPSDAGVEPTFTNPEPAPAAPEVAPIPGATSTPEAKSAKKPTGRRKVKPVTPIV